jgi:leucyl-tRNA synthetase
VKQEDIDKLEKEGVFTGSYAINPITKNKVPVYAGNFVVADYGSGMIMAVPGHDERDFQFAKKYKIPIKIVIDPVGLEIENKEKMTYAYTEEGNLINSGKFNGLGNKEAIKKISIYIENNNFGKKVINYKLRDWLISRQRFWGTPIPIIYCDKCGIVPVPEKDLPVRLPENIKFTSEKNPLIDNKEFVDVKCPKCGGKGKRETDTMDTFVNSSWYFFRYCDAKNSKEIFDRKKAKYWMPIDLYIGGAEHACMHLIYFRFYTKFLRDLGLTDLDEPTQNLFNQGMIHGEDGYVMSKSRGNVIDPLDVSKKYSADTLRIFLVSVASPDKDSSWSSTGIESMHKFVNKFVSFILEVKRGKSSERAESKINKAIKEITNDIEVMQYNLAIIKLRQLTDSLLDEKEISKSDLEKIVKLISPFCPHITEELWEKLGNKNFISLEKWPICDEKKINDKLEEQEKAIENLVGDINNVLRIVGAKNKVSIYVIPKEKEIYENAIDVISKRTNLEVSIYSVNDKDRYDPEGKSKKAKLGKPAIYLE